MTTLETYPPAAPALAAGRPYPFPTRQGVRLEVLAAFDGPNADAAVRAASGYAHPFVWEALDEEHRAQLQGDARPLVTAWWHAVRVANHLRRYCPEDVAPPASPFYETYMPPLRDWSGARAFAAVAFLVADELEPEPFDLLTAAWAATITMPTLTRKNPA